MIYIVEIPHESPPRAWSCCSKEKTICAIDDACARYGEPHYEELTGRDLLAAGGYPSTDAMRREDRALADEIDAHGLEAKFCRLYGEHEYRYQQVDRWEAALEWNAHDLSSQKVYMTDDEARAALEDDSEWQMHQGQKARIALEQELEEQARSTRRTSHDLHLHRI